MWRDTLKVIKVSLFEKPSLTATLFGAVVLLTLLAPVPVLGQLAFLLNLILVFSFLVFTSKVFLRCEGDLARMTLEFRRSSLATVVGSWFLETLGVLVGHLVLWVLAALLAFILFLIGGSVFLVLPLIKGEGIGWTGLIGTVVLAVVLYFSVVTSFPIFFGRSMVRGSGFWGTFYTFLSSLVAEISWRTILNCDYLRSSVVISLFVLLIFLLNLVFVLAPFLFFLSPLVGLLALHTAYTFGTVACFRLLRS